MPAIGTSEVTSYYIEIWFKVFPGPFHEIMFNRVEFLLIEVDSRTFIFFLKTDDKVMQDTF